MATPGRVRNVPSPLPSSTEKAPEVPLATARSARPSLLKSLTVAEHGLPPAAKSLRATNDTGWATAGAESAGQTASAAATTNHRFAEGLVIGFPPTSSTAATRPSE